MGEPKNPHFYDFGISEPVTEPKNQLFLSLETPGYVTKNREFPNLYKLLLHTLTIYLIDVVLGAPASLASSASVPRIGHHKKII